MNEKFSVLLFVTSEYTRVSSYMRGRVAAVSILYGIALSLSNFIPLTRSQTNPLQRVISVKLPAQFHIHQQPQHTQQERLNSKRLLLTPCCALLLWVLQSSHGSQARKQQCQCLSLLVSRASTLTKMTTPNNVSPAVCLPNPDQPKF